MKHLVITSAVMSVLCLGTGLPALADVIDFEAQAANAGGFLTGIPDSPLTVGFAIFTGGELRQGEVGLPADQTGVYATEGLFGADLNPLTITFSTPVRAFSVFLKNGDAQNQSYTISDNLGDIVTRQLALSGALSGSTATMALPGNGITSVTISSSNTNFWNFAIDDVSVTAIDTPEPATVGLCAAALVFLSVYVRARSCR